MAVQRSGDLPLYRQVAVLLEKQVREGVYAAGQPVPAEHDLADQLAVSRETIRRAIGLLVERGILYRRRGIGTFANPGPGVSMKIERSLAHLFGLGGELSRKVSNPSVRLLAAEERVPPPAIASRLELPEGARAFFVRRLILGGAEPIWVEERYFRRRLPVSNEALAGLSMMELLSQRCGITVQKAELHVEAALASTEEARLLKLARPAAVLIGLYALWSEEPLPVEGGRSVFRSDRYRFTATLSRGVESEE